MTEKEFEELEKDFRSWPQSVPPIPIQPPPRLQKPPHLSSAEEEFNKAVADMHKGVRPPRPSRRKQSGEASENKLNPVVAIILVVVLVPVFLKALHGARSSGSSSGSSSSYEGNYASANEQQREKDRQAAYGAFRNEGFNENESDRLGRQVEAMHNQDKEIRRQRAKRGW